MSVIWRDHYKSADEARAAVIAEARTWLKTPWAHAQDCKGAGVDCAMILVRCFVDTHCIEPFDPRPYPMQWYLHQTEARYLGFVEKYGKKIDRAAALPADIDMFNFGHAAAHGAIVLDNRVMIHAHRPARMVLMDERSSLAHRHDSTWSLFV